MHYMSLYIEDLFGTALFHDDLISKDERKRSMVACISSIVWALQRCYLTRDEIMNFFKEKLLWLSLDGAMKRVTHDNNVLPNEKTEQIRRVICSLRKSKYMISFGIAISHPPEYLSSLFIIIPNFSCKSSQNSDHSLS